MAKAVTVKLHYSGFNELRNGADVVALCEEVAHDAISGLDGYTVDTVRGKSRATTRITATSEKAISDNLKNNTLVKAVKA